MQNNMVLIRLGDLLVDIDKAKQRIQTLNKMIKNASKNIQSESDLDIIEDLRKERDSFESYITEALDTRWIQVPAAYAMALPTQNIFGGKG